MTEISSKSIIIVGAGIASLSTALLLHAFSDPTTNHHITIHELRAEPSRNGGAVNLTANALRILDLQLGLYERLKPLGISVKTIELVSCSSGKEIASLPFGDVERYGYESLRIMRKDLQRVLLEECIRLGIEVNWDRQLAGVEEDEEGKTVTAKFKDGTSVTGDILLGCDGTFSATRTFVEPDRVTIYPGLAAASGFAESKNVSDSAPFHRTALFQSRRGTVMLSYIHENLEQIYWTALTETAEAGSKDGWRAVGNDKIATKQKILERFGSHAVAGNLSAIQQVVEQTDEVFFWPVFRLEDGGKWYKGRVLLLGDAAHAMPPQGQGVGLALEDAVIIARLLTSPTSVSRTHTELFEAYTRIRTPHVHRDYVRASTGFDELKDVGWLWNTMKEWSMWFVLKWYKKMFDEAFLYDVMKVELFA